MPFLLFKGYPGQPNSEAHHFPPSSAEAKN